MTQPFRGWHLAVPLAILVAYVVQLLLLPVVAKFALAGTGYVAVLVCAGVYHQGRTVEDVFSEELIHEPASAVMQARIVPGGVTASIVGGLFSHTATYDERFGCTLQGATYAPVSSVDVPLATSAAEKARRISPGGRVDTLQALVDAQFVDTPEVRRARTRAITILRASTGEVLAAGNRPTEKWLEPGARLHSWSMAKSVLNALIGARIMEGGLSLNASALLREWCISVSDGRCGITLKHLLQMSSGLEFDESYTPLGGVTQMLFNGEDTAATAAAGALKASPGTRFSYSSGTTNLVSRILRSSFESDEAYWDFPRKALFGPLGMTTAVAQRDPAGTFIFSSHVYACAEDWARFGALFARDGLALDGTRLLPEGWAAFSASPAPACPSQEYGAHWWIPPPFDPAAGGPPRPPRQFLRYSARLAQELGAMYASGYANQITFVLPGHDLVIFRGGLFTEGEPSEAWDAASFIEAAIDAVAAEAQA